MQKLLAFALCSAVLLLTVAPADAGRRHRHWHGRDRVIIERNTGIGVGAGLLGVLLAAQLMAQQKPVVEEPYYAPLPREPKLRRDSPIPLK